MDKYNGRFEAGIMLATRLKAYARDPRVVVLALPRGGVPVAYEIAKELSVPLDVYIVRKLGVPGYEELAMGAIASGGVVVFNEQLIKEFQISQLKINEVIEAERQELERRELAYRGKDAPPLKLKDKIVILVDDGMATGASIQAAIKGIRKKKPMKLIVAVPVAPPSTEAEIAVLVDELVCSLKPLMFNAVGCWYEDFTQVPNEEVARLLKKARSGQIMLNRRKNDQ